MGSLTALPDTVCHVNLAPGFRGGERQTQLLVSALSARGWPQRLIARRGEPLAEACRGLPGLELVECSASRLRASRAMSGVKLVHVHQGRSLAAAALNYRYRGVPYVVTRRVQQGPRHTALNRWMYRHAAAVVTLSSAISASVRELDPQLSPIMVPSARADLRADPAETQRIRERAGRAIIVGHIGALDDAHKGQRQIIRLARELESSVPEIGFVLVGDGPDEKVLRAAAGDLKNVHFAGRVANVGDYLAAFDIFIYPSRHEGLGSVLLDAMAFGLPVIATDIGGIPDIIEDSVNGFLCDVEDIGAMRSRLTALAAGQPLRDRMGSVNREKSRQFSADKMTDSYVKIYGHVTADRTAESK